MIPSLEYIEQKFNEFNALCFEGKLPLLPFQLSHSRTFLGLVSFRQKQLADGTMHYSDFIFKISDKWDLPEEEIEDTILHEMIHYYILSNQMQDTAPHGILFTNMMRSINVKFNRNISVMHKTTEEDLDKDTRIRQHYVCFTRLRNGKRGVVVAMKSKLFEIWEGMKKIPGVDEQKWFLTTDPFFNRFPRATKPAFYQVPSYELDEHLKDAVELENTGKTIRPKKA